MSEAIQLEPHVELSPVKLRENLFQLMKKRNVTMSQIYKSTGIPISTIQRICKDTNANPTLSSLLPIADFFSISIAQLVGEYPLPFSDTSDLQGKTMAIHSEIPIISWADTISWPKVPADTIKDTVLTELALSATAFALRITEDDLDNFHKDSLLIVDPELTPENRDYVIVHKNTMKVASLKQLLIHEDEKYLKPMMRGFKTTIFDKTYRLLGVVKQIKMNMRN